MIRRVRAGEWERLRELRLAALLDAPAAYSSTHAETAARPEQFWMHWAENGASSAGSATFVAEATDGRWLGMACGFEWPDNPGVVELVAMWVAPEARRAGVGRQLVDAVVAWALEGGWDRVHLGVADGNDAAERLYAACGFEATGETVPLKEGSERCQRTMVYRRR